MTLYEKVLLKLCGTFAAHDLYEANCQIRRLEFTNRNLTAGIRANADHHKRVREALAAAEQEIKELRDDLAAARDAIDYAHEAASLDTRI